MTSPGTRRTSSLDGFSPEALFVLSGIAQYTGAVIAISLFDRLGAAPVAWLRVIGGAVVVCALYARSLRSVVRARFGPITAFGVVTALMNLCFYLGIERIDLGKSVAIEFIGPIAVAAALTRTSRNAAALGLAVAGVLVLSGGELSGQPIGLLFLLAASALWAGYIVAGRRLALATADPAGLGVGLAVGAVVLAPVGAPGSGPAWHDMGLLGAALLAGVLSNALGYGIEQNVFRRIPVRRFALLLALLPVTAMVIGLIALDQRPSAADLAGAALVIAAIAVQEREEIVPAAGPAP